MSEIRYVPPPEPPGQEPWCILCLMLAKGRLWAKHEAQLRTWAEDGKHETHWVPWDDTLTLEPAMIKAFTDVPALGIVDTCWTHMAGAETGTRTKLLESPAPLPAGFVKGAR